MKRIAFMLVLLFAFSAQLLAQSISGKVVGAEDGLPIPGVTVSVKGFMNVGTLTDMDGKYQINLPADATTLVFSFVGMTSQEVVIGGRSVIDVTLKTEDIGLEEVVVLGYTTKGKNEITGSTVQISAAQLEDVPVVSVDQALQGKVAGLSISASSGTPGSTQDIRIRGVGSITAGNAPLFVVDGVPVDNSNYSGDAASLSSLSALAAFNSNDIASITVLKDASATSAYGARGSNGVIVITTKKGAKGKKTAFTLSTDYGFQNAAIAGQKQLTGAQRKELFLDGVFNSYGATYGFTRAEAEDFTYANGLDYGD